MLYLFVILSLQPNGNSNISQNLLLAGWDSAVDVEFVVIKVISLTMWSTNDILKYGSQPGIGRMRYFAANVDFCCCCCSCHFINLELKLRSHLVLARWEIDVDVHFVVDVVVVISINVERNWHPQISVTSWHRQDVTKDWRMETRPCVAPFPF